MTAMAERVGSPASATNRTTSTARSGSTNPDGWNWLRYAIRRGARLLPAYWLSLLVMLLSSITATEFAPTGTVLGPPEPPASTIPRQRVNR